MHSRKIAILLLLTIAVCLAVLKSKRDSVNAITLGNLMYFSETTENRTREGALAYCAEEGGELAKVWNIKLYNQLRLAIRKTGSYWIDGIDGQNLYRFDMNYTCTNHGEYFNLYDMRASNLDIPTISCLTLQNGSSESSSKLLAKSCNEELYVLCQYPLNGCNGKNESTTGAYGYYTNRYTTDYSFYGTK